MSAPDAYELYRSGLGLLEQGDHHAATLPLGRARDLAPGTAMVREALGRALFGAQRYREAADEFAALVELEPVNHYAQFCLGRALQLQGRHAEARPPLTMAALLQPQRRDYVLYRDRTVAALEERDAAAPAGRPFEGRRRHGDGPWGAPDGSDDEAPPGHGSAAGGERVPDEESSGDDG